MQLPNFLVIGAAKCGTTSLYHYVLRHPQIFLPEQKELHYFTSEHIAERLEGPGDSSILPKLCTTRPGYERHFDAAGAHRAVGEFSPSYFHYAEVAERIRGELGAIKIILLLRDPIEKAFSQYMHLVRDGRETLDFTDALDAETSRTAAGWAGLWQYAQSSLYADRLQRYLSVFGRAAVKVVVFEELVHGPGNVLPDLLEFLEVDPAVELDTSRAYHRSGRPRSTWIARWLSGGGRPSRLAMRWGPRRLSIAIRDALIGLNVGQKGEMSGTARARLADYFADDVREVERLLGRNLAWLS